MFLKNTEMTNFIKELRNVGDVEFSEIPNMHMYMEQMLCFLNQHLDPTKRDSNDKTLTKPMINNYTKSEILLPPKNKKYTKEHIVQLVLIYQLKNILSISDIHALFKSILKDMSTPEDDVISLKDIYLSYLELKTESFDEFTNLIRDKMVFINEKTAHIQPESNRQAAEIFLLILTLIAQANAAKRLAERLIDTYMTSTDENGQKIAI